MTMEVERLLVVSPNWLGDAIMALPAIGDLRRHFPRSRLLVAARKSVAGLFAMTPIADEVVVLEWAGRLWSRASRRADVEKLRSAHADLGVVLPNSFASAWLIKSAGIRERWGYAADLRDRLLSRAVPRPAIRVHQSEYYRRLIKGLDIENGSLEPALVVSPQTLDDARILLNSKGWGGSRRFVVMAPGAAYGGAKRWPAEHYANVAEQLIRHQQIDCVLIGGSADAATTSWVRTLVPEDSRARVIDLAGATQLDTLAGVLRLASACVSNDSGAMHLAGALGVPLAALFGPTRERETSPLSGEGGRVQVLINHVWCRPCMLRECPLDHRCMNGLSPDRVTNALTELMMNRELRIPNPGSRIPDPEP
ncbi:MAG TPA: lipopolysaccharide heptosyltransferase II [Vicinamibacterales bacterium]|nr:lipopolysaccharide heptosyltransferase II [Vicinamibacterales bacterium]